MLERTASWKEWVLSFMEFGASIAHACVKAMVGRTAALPEVSDGG